jgi:hypothetical protein
MRPSLQKRHGEIGYRALHLGRSGTSLGGSASDPVQDVAVDLPWFLQVQKVASAADDHHAGGWREKGLSLAGQPGLDAAVVGPVQVEGFGFSPAVSRVRIPPT